VHALQGRLATAEGLVVLLAEQQDLAQQIAAVLAEHREVLGRHQDLHHQYFARYETTECPRDEQA